MASIRLSLTCERAKRGKGKQPRPQCRPQPGPSQRVSYRERWCTAVPRDRRALLAELVATAMEEKNSTALPLSWRCAPRGAPRCCARPDRSANSDASAQPQLPAALRQQPRAATAQPLLTARGPLAAAARLRGGNALEAVQQAYLNLPLGTRCWSSLIGTLAVLSQIGLLQPEQVAVDARDRQAVADLAAGDGGELPRRPRPAAHPEALLPDLVRPPARGDARPRRVPPRARLARGGAHLPLPRARLAVHRRRDDHGDHRPLRPADARRADLALRPQHPVRRRAFLGAILCAVLLRRAPHSTGTRTCRSPSSS